MSRLLKRSQVIVGEYLFKFSPNEQIDPYNRLLPLITVDEESQIYIDSLRNDTEFREYFLKQNSEFVSLLQNSNELERLSQDKFEINRLIEHHRKNPIFAWRQEAKQFPLVSKLVRVLGVLPYSTAAIERTFSAMANVKTTKRNRLTVLRLQAYLLVKQDYEKQEFELTSRNS